MDSISLSKILYFSSFFIWLITPIRQYKSKYFLFFLILAVSDTLNVSIYYFFNKNFSGFIFSISTFLMIISLFERTTIIKSRLPIVLILIAILVANIFITEPNFYYTIFIINYFTIAFIILKRFIVTYVDNRIMNLFLIVLLFYLSTTLLKLFNIIIGFADATAFFIITTIVQIAFGLFFSIFRENNKRLMVQL